MHLWKLQQKLFWLHFKYPNGDLAIIKTFLCFKRKISKIVVVCMLNTDIIIEIDLII